jgi:16S rRNA (guanine966-N2)-methyltransferase
VLDLYAGTGALGIEALSRGADYCDFVESNPRARSLILENLRRTGFAGKASVHGLNAQAAVSTFHVAYDLILADPPYSDPAILALITAVGHSELIGARSFVILEHARSIDLPARAGRLHLVRSRYHGTSALTLYEVSSATEGA